MLKETTQERLSRIFNSLNEKLAEPCEWALEGRFPLQGDGYHVFAEGAKLKFDATWSISGHHASLVKLQRHWDALGAGVENGGLLAERLHGDYCRPDEEPQLWLELELPCIDSSLRKIFGGYGRADRVDPSKADVENNPAYRTFVERMAKEGIEVGINRTSGAWPFRFNSYLPPEVNLSLKALKVPAAAPA